MEAVAVDCSAPKIQKCEYHSVLFEFDKGDDDCELNRIFNELYEYVDEDDLHDRILRVDGDGDVESEILRVCKEHEEEMYQWLMRVDLVDSPFKFHLIDYVSSLLWPCCDKAFRSPPHTQVADDDREDDEFGGGVSFDLSNALFETLLVAAKLEMGERAAIRIASARSVDPSKLDEAAIRAMKRFEAHLVRTMAKAFATSPYALSLRNILRQRIRRVCQKYTGSVFSYDNVSLPEFTM
jgi:hypothetical protein